jgi:hypothetical protein
MRTLNEMFSIDDEGYLVKTSNGERVPEDEPLFILRGRDFLAVQAIYHYLEEMIESGCDSERIAAVRKVAKQFVDFEVAHPERVKLPGSTHGH